MKLGLVGRNGAGKTAVCHVLKEKDFRFIHYLILSGVKSRREA